MKILNKTKTIIILLLGMILNNWSLAHDGGHHQDEILISDLKSLGEVNFEVTCKPGAQKSMNIGVALLHHMMYAQAQKTFKDIAKNNPDCAMAYWGYAMTLFHPIWPDTISNVDLARGEAVIQKAQSFRATNHREKMYIQAAATFYENWQSRDKKTRIKDWEKAQKRVYELYPQDVESAAFYALAHLSTADKDDKSLSHQKRAGDILDDLYIKAPKHPGVIHYSIHAYDNPELAPRAVEVARAYDKIAPDLPHSLHMPSHIFVRLGLWNDVVSWNIRSAKAALKYPTKNTTSLHYLHAIDYLVYAYMQVNEHENAKQALKEIEEYHNHQDTFVSAYAFAAIPARYYLEQQIWNKAKSIKVRHPDYLSWDKFPQLEAITYFAKGLGAARNNDLEEAEKYLDKLDKLYNKTLNNSSKYWAILVDSQRKSVKAWILYQQGNKSEALQQLSLAAELEDSVEKSPVTPGSVLPARELLAEMLFLNHQYQESLSAYEQTLAINPNRLKSLLGAAHSNQLLGNVSQANFYSNLLAKLGVKNQQQLLTIQPTSPLFSIESNDISDIKVN